MILAVLIACSIGQGGPLKLESDSLKVEVDRSTGHWSLVDMRSGVRWPSEGHASVGDIPQFKNGFIKADKGHHSLRLMSSTGASVLFELADDKQALDIRYESVGDGTIRVFNDLLKMNSAQGGYAIVPCREGLLIPAEGDPSFKRMFGTNDYEGSHMTMLGLAKNSSALIVTWDNAYTFPEIERKVSANSQELTTTFELRKSARSLRITPIGKGDWNTIASEYRKISEQKGYAVTLKEKIARNPEFEKLIGACNLKLWHLYIQRMNEESTEMKYQKVRWTFEETAQIAEHMRNDLEIDRCLYILGGWINGGYDNGHPDILPANEPCGGNAGLIDAMDRIEKLGYVSCLHDNYQDMYRNAKSYDTKYTVQHQDGSLARGGYWFGGIPDIACSPMQLELAQRQQNLPDVQRLFSPQCYFIDTVFAVSPKECYAPAHPMDRNGDLAWKQRLSDYTRDMFGLFGSEGGREWAIPHSDVFEGITAVFGRSFHGLKPEQIGATVIPFWEMVYHDCTICHGKYSCKPENADKSVAQHVLYARPFFHHFNETYPDHLYWKAECGTSSDEDAADDAVQAAWGDEKQEPWCFSPDVSVFCRGDNGWADGFDSLDVFMKNTHEILSPLHRMTAYDRLTHLEYLTSDRTFQQAVYGNGNTAATIIVNFGSEDAKVASKYGGHVILPQWGFVIDSPQFAAFYAKRYNGTDYETGAVFTVSPKDGKPLDQSKRIKIFHAFGSDTIKWNDDSYKIQTEQVIEIK
jgi:hypothetical protein